MGSAAARTGEKTGETTAETGETTAETVADPTGPKARQASAAPGFGAIKAGAVVAGLNDTRRNGSVPTEGEHELGSHRNGDGNLYGQWIVHDRGHEIGWPVSVAPAGRRVSHPLVDCAVPGALAPYIANSLSGLSNPPSRSRRRSS